MRRMGELQRGKSMDGKVRGGFMLVTPWEQTGSVEDQMDKGEPYWLRMDTITFVKATVRGTKLGRLDSSTVEVAETVDEVLTMLAGPVRLAATG